MRLTALPPRPKAVSSVRRLTLKSIQEGGDVSELRRRFKDVLASVVPFEILTIEQQLGRVSRTLMNTRWLEAS
ncbi:MAG: DUF438 domain-containing protein [Zestosphaera sp.]